MLDVARAAEVRLLTIWRVMRDLPISEQQAQQVYAGLYRLAGVPYRGRIRLHTAKSDPHNEREASTGQGARLTLPSLLYSTSRLRNARG
jgi:hypothetical protein